MSLTTLPSITWYVTELMLISFLNFLALYLLARIFLALADHFNAMYFYNHGILWSGLPFGAVGICTGFIAGDSHSPVVGALIPAALTLVGTVTLYVIGKERDQIIMAGFCIIVFIFNLLVGTGIGAKSREEIENGKEDLEYLKKGIDKEFQLQQYRRAYGLPENPTSRSSSETSPPAK